MTGSPLKDRCIVVVDDDINVLTSYRVALGSFDMENVVCCEDSRKALEVIEARQPDLVLLDLMMPHITGEELLDELSSRYPDIPIIITTGINEIKKAVECIHRGAFDYLVKPVDVDRLELSIRKALDVRMLREENRNLANRLLKGQLENPEVFSSMITRSSSMLSIFQYCEAIGRSTHPVLITGETGVGKELIAKALHDISGRKGRFVPVNMAGLDDQMVNDTLFGHKKGSFTGADSERKGLIEQAAGGSLFLDEIGDLKQASQVKLLRVLQEREFYPIGSDTPASTDTRFIFATHADLDKMQREGNFRQDLFYRLRIHHIHVPPLRERREDIQHLFEHFLEIAARELKKNTPHYPQELMNLLENHSFPGNVRELQSVVYEAVSRHTSKTLSTRVFREWINERRDSRGNAGNRDGEENWISTLEVLPTLKESNTTLVREAMRRTGNNQRAAAELLGISHQALNKRLKKMADQG